MASDSSAYPLSHVLVVAAAAAAAAHHCPPKPMSPAEAIAAAWANESAESQLRWRAADACAKEKFYAPHPWRSLQIFFIYSSPSTPLSPYSELFLARCNHLYRQPSYLYCYRLACQGSQDVCYHHAGELCWSS
ncbi:hypothetical protein BDW22DRAFT_559212 [Trametopsis cervina]|nr:hypothetical protein BDW22DRAFT_559212 [Trametopsis cervina]